MRAQFLIRIVVFGFSLCCLCGQSLAEAPNQTVPGSPQSVAKREGFFDYALGKINPEDKNYGASMQLGRDAIVGNSIDDLYFWSNVVTLLLLSGLVAVVLLQWRGTDKREVVAASLIAQLWNGRVSDRIEIERRTTEFNRLVEAHNAEVERTLSQPPKASEQDAETAENLTRSVRSLTGSQRPSPEPAEKSTAAVPDGDSAGLQQSNLLLQRRVEALQNSEQNLKQRLNQTTVLLDQERRRNATLKGA
jgi:hypothetical protein